MPLAKAIVAFIAEQMPAEDDEIIEEVLDAEEVLSAWNRKIGVLIMRLAVALQSVDQDTARTIAHEIIEPAKANWHNRKSARVRSAFRFHNVDMWVIEFLSHINQRAYHSGEAPTISASQEARITKFHNELARIVKVEKSRKS